MCAVCDWLFDESFLYEDDKVDDKEDEEYYVERDNTGARRGVRRKPDSKTKTQAEVRKSKRRLERDKKKDYDNWEVCFGEESGHAVEEFICRRKCRSRFGLLML